MGDNDKKKKIEEDIKKQIEIEEKLKKEEEGKRKGEIKEGSPYYLIKNKDKLSSTLNNGNNSENDFKKIRNELNYYKSAYEKLKEENINLKNTNTRLSNELIKANKIISSFNNKSNENNDYNEIINLKKVIMNKDNEIMNLKFQISNNTNNNKQSVDLNDIIVVNFLSSDQIINNCGIKCLRTETFAEVEEKLYKKYDEFRNTNNNFLVKGKIVLRFKKIFENGIQEGDIIQLIKIE